MWTLDEPTAERLRRWLDEQGLAARELAASLGWSEAMMSRVLSGERGFSPDKRLKFAQCYGTQTYIDLFGTIPDTDENKLRQELQKEHNNGQCNAQTGQ